jgi:hypothetical protein
MLDFTPYILSSAAGLVLVIGCLLLLWKGRIVLDTEGKSVSQIELPLGIKFATQFPVLIIFLLGVVLLVYPIYQARNICIDLLLHTKAFPEMVRISGEVVSKEPLDVFAILDEQPNTHNAVILNVPFRKDARYRVVYALDNQVLENASFYLTNSNPYTLPRYEVQSAPRPSPSPDEGPVKTVPKDLAAKFKREGDQ